MVVAILRRYHYHLPSDNYCFIFRVIPIIYLHDCCNQIVHISKLILACLQVDALGFFLNANININGKYIDSNEARRLIGQQVRDSQNDTAYYISDESSDSGIDNQQNVNPFQVATEHFSPAIINIPAISTYQPLLGTFVTEMKYFQIFLQILLRKLAKWMFQLIQMKIWLK